MQRKQMNVNAIVFTRAGHLNIKALEQVFLRDGVRAADKYFDAWRQRVNTSMDGGMRYLLTDDVSKLLPLSKVYNQDGLEGV
eukprot:2130299-Ditylum_brightwellii.AAC.1